MLSKCPACGGNAWQEMFDEYTAIAPAHCDRCGWTDIDGCFFPSFFQIFSGIFSILIRYFKGKFFQAKGCWNDIDMFFRKIRWR